MKIGQKSNFLSVNIIMDLPFYSKIYIVLVESCSHLICNNCMLCYNYSCHSFLTSKFRARNFFKLSTFDSVYVTDIWNSKIPQNHGRTQIAVVIEKEIEIHKSFANDLHISPFCLQRMHISPIKWSALLCFNIGWQHISARNGHSLI